MHPASLSPSSIDAFRHRPIWTSQYDHPCSTSALARSYTSSNRLHQLPIGSREGTWTRQQHTEWAARSARARGFWDGGRRRRVKRPGEHTRECRCGSIRLSLVAQVHMWLLREGFHTIEASREVKPESRSGRAHFLPPSRVLTCH